MKRENEIFLTDDDNAALLAAVESFADEEIASRWDRPEIAIDSAALGCIRDAAAHHGLLGSVQDGIGLWSELAHLQAPRFTLSALRTLARRNTAAALHLHLCGLAQAVLPRLEAGVTLPANVACTLQPPGALGWGRSALSRWWQQAATADDLALLSDNYGERPRPVWVADSTEQLIIPVFQEGRFWLAGFWKEGAGLERHPLTAPAHGLDGLTLASCQASANPSQRWPLPASLWRELITAHLLGLTAIALGAVERASALAHAYSEARVQGGRHIIQHDAVAVFMGDIRGALLAVESQFNGCMGGRGFTALDQAISLKSNALQALRTAADAAVQLHGGSGYMRDVGVECVLRDINCLRLMGGTPDELALLLAAEHAPTAAQIDKTDCADALPGFVSPAHALAPLRVFQRLPLVRAMAAYTPESPRQRDNHDLPPALARYRNEVEAFAERELRPHALRLDQTLGAAHTEPFAARPAVLDEVIRAAGRAGLLSDLLPKPLGSLPLSCLRFSLAWSQTIRTEALARADGGLMLALSAQNLGLLPVILSGNLNVLKNIVLPAFRACEQGQPQLFAYAITEPTAGSDAEDGHGAARNTPRLVAYPAPGGWRLRGRKVFISGGDHARWVVAFAALAGEGFVSWTAFLVDTQSPGFTRVRNELKMGMRCSGATELEFDDCFVPDARVLGGVRQGWALNRATLNYSRLPVAGMAVGFAQNALDIATDFVCRTHLGGQPLLHQQQVQLKLADMQAIVAAMRALLWRYARAWTPWQSEAALAKFHLTDEAQRVIDLAMALCGEGGLAQSLGLEKVFRDNRLTRIFEGTNQINRLAVIEDQQSSLLANIARWQSVSSNLIQFSGV